MITFGRARLLPSRSVLTRAVVASSLCAVAVFAQDQPLRAVVIGDATGAIASRITTAGYTVSSAGLDTVADANALQTANPDLLVLCDSSRLPVTSVEPIQTFLKSGGDLIALNTPMWRTFLVRDGDAWIERDELLRRHASELMQQTVVDFAKGVDGWTKSSNSPDGTARYEVVTDASAPLGKALHVAAHKVSGWETFIAPVMQQPFPAGHDITVIVAKGSPSVPQLSVEWEEQDGSRWIATVTLSNDWAPHIISPEQFTYWESNPARKDDRFHPENARKLSIGLAHTHTRLGREPHEYWVASVGTSPRTPVHDAALASAQAPALETLCPAYKFFDCSDIATIGGRNDQPFVPRGPYALPAKVHGIHPRPGAGGFDKGRTWRWQALLEAQTADGEWRGNPAAFIVHADGPYKNGIWASFAIEDQAWYESDQALAAIEGIARAMHRGMFLVDGGANFYRYFSDQLPTLGARVVNLANSPTSPTVSMAAYAHGSRKPIANWQEQMTVQPFTTVVLSPRSANIDWPADGADVEVSLHDSAGDVIDRAVHQANFWQAPQYPAFITVENGDFKIDGKRWRPHGVNYMPSSGIGVEDHNYFEYWLGTEAYDPEIVQRDLLHMKDMGLNSVSIFLYRRSMESQNLLDLLCRLEELDMNANLSLRPGTPLDFQWDAVREMIEYYRLAQIDTVFAYDLAWEPMFGNQKDRRQYDPLWRAWIDERYGSIENAEADWQFQAPRDESGAVACPPGEQFEKDGPWRVMALAYRRFLDTLLYEKYSEARRLVRSIDPNHLVSFRMTLAGDPTWRGTAVIPYSWQYLPGAVDILEPEAYGRIGDWEKVKPGIFQFEYARWAHAGLPMMWAEAGVSAWDVSAMRSTPKNLEYQATFYSDIYRMLLESGSDGVFFWWYPGGFRTNERSDYGIINPDGSDRPVTRVIRSLARTITGGPGPRDPQRYIEFDPDGYVDGIAGAYAAVQEQFWQGMEAGGRVGLRTQGTGTTSATCPRVAVGNVPLTGRNPPKYLDAFFDSVTVTNAKGETQRVRSGDTVAVKSGKAIEATVTLTNLGEATLLDPRGGTIDGGVWFEISTGQHEAFVTLPRDLKRFETESDMPLTLAPIVATLPVTVEVRLKAQNVAYFGPKLRLNLVSE